MYRIKRFFLPENFAQPLQIEPIRIKGRLRAGRFESMSPFDVVVAWALVLGITLAPVTAGEPKPTA